MILATCQHHILKPHTVHSEFCSVVRSHNDHLSPTTGKFLKLEKEEENEMEKRRKVVRCPVSPMSET